LSQAERRDSFLRFFSSMISALYTQVEGLDLLMESKYPFLNESAYPIVIEENLFLYMSRLPNLRRLCLCWSPGSFSETGNTYPLEKLEYLDIVSVGLLHRLHTPNLLCLRFTWGHHRNFKALTYRDLRRLLVTYDHTRSMIDPPELSFPSLQDLTLSFQSFGSPDTYWSSKLSFFSVLTSITIISRRYEPQGTMLCFALLNQPDECPMLNEIKFLECFPDWDILFLMLERRNFMINSTVSLIRRITLPFIPIGFRTPLASLLRGTYTRRPTDDDLFMGGSRELLLDEQVSVFRL
jgi:hypothetical protein